MFHRFSVIYDTLITGYKFIQNHDNYASTMIPERNIEIKLFLKFTQVLLSWT